MNSTVIFILRSAIDIYATILLIRLLLQLVQANFYSPASQMTVLLVSQIIEPYMRPFRKFIPPIGMIDISPMAAIFTLMIIRAQVLPMLGGLIQPFLS